MKPSIICVDDETIILHCLKEQLMLNFGSSYRIEITESGREALEILKETLAANEEVPLILTDYIMPDMKGDALLKKIHGMSPETVLILLTGQATLQGVTNAVNEAGVFKYLEKPWKYENLFAIVSEALDHYYQERTLNRINEQLRKINRQLEQTIAQRSEDLAINRQMLLSTERIHLVKQWVADLTSEVNQILADIKAGMAEIWRRKPQIHHCTPEIMGDYLQVVTDFYGKVSDVFQDLIDFFERDKLQQFFYAPEINRFDEIYANVTATRRRIAEEVTRLLNLLNEGKNKL